MSDLDGGAPPGGAPPAGAEGRAAVGGSAENQERPEQRGDKGATTTDPAASSERGDVSAKPPQAEAKPEAKVEAKAEAKPDAKLEANRSAEQHASKPQPNHSDASTPPPEAKPEAKPEAQKPSEPPKPSEAEGDAASEEGVGSFVEGAVVGGFSDNQSWSAVAGQVAVGLTPLGVVADVRDTVAAVGDVLKGKDGGWTNLAMAGVGFIPIAGDAIKAGVRTTSRAAKGAERGAAAAARQAEKAAARSGSEAANAGKSAERAAPTARGDGPPKGGGDGPPKGGGGGDGPRHGDGPGPYSGAKKGPDGVWRTRSELGDYDDGLGHRADTRQLSSMGRAYEHNELLGHSLEAVGDWRPPGHEPHHIVPSNVHGIDDIRTATEKAFEEVAAKGDDAVTGDALYGRKLDSAANGVWLPGTGDVPNPNAMPPHRAVGESHGVHVNPNHPEYGNYLREQLTGADGKLLQGAELRNKIQELKTRTMLVTRTTRAGMGHTR